MNKDARFTH